MSLPLSPRSKPRPDSSATAGKAKPPIPLEVVGPIDTQARSALVMEVETGTVLLDKNAEERIPPASMSKLMTAYLVFDYLKQGRAKLDDELPVSEKAWRTGGSKMFVPLGERVKISDLIRGMVVQSGNDACVVLAEGLAGSEERVCRGDEPKGERNRAPRQPFRQCRWAAEPGSLDDGA